MGDDAPQHTGFRRRCGASGIGEPLVTVVPLLLLEAMGNRKTQLRVAGSGRRQRVVLTVAPPPETYENI